jgi:hypothetical protein
MFREQSSALSDYVEQLFQNTFINKRRLTMIDLNNASILKELKEIIPLPYSATFSVQDLDLSNPSISIRSLSTNRSLATIAQSGNIVAN